MTTCFVRRWRLDGVEHRNRTVFYESVRHATSGQRVIWTGSRLPFDVATIVTEYEHRPPASRG